MLYLIQICILFSILPSYDLYPPPPSIWQLQEEANCLATCGYDDDSYSDKGNDQLAGYDKGAKKLIAMGFPAPLHTHPWVVAIDVTIECSGLNGTKKNFRCTGAIIHERHVLSSAHCFHIMTDDLPSGCWMNSHSIVFPKFFKVSAEAVKIYAKQNLNTTTEDDVYEIEDWEAHPEFNTDLLPGTDGALKADMAILRLKQKKQFQLGNTNLRKICLPTTALTNEMGPGRLFMMAGFGRTLNESDSTKTQSRISNELREVTLQMGDRKYCNSIDAMVTIHPPYRIFCGSRRERGGLEGDSGAPAMVVSPTNGKWFLLGVFSQIKTYSELKNTQPDFFMTWDDLACKFLKEYTLGMVKCQVFDKALDGHCHDILFERKKRLNRELCGYRGAKCIGNKSAKDDSIPVAIQSPIIADESNDNAKLNPFANANPNSIVNPNSMANPSNSIATPNSMANPSNSIATPNSMANPSNSIATPNSMANPSNSIANVAGRMCTYSGARVCPFGFVCIARKCHKRCFYGIDKCPGKLQCIGSFYCK